MLKQSERNDVLRMIGIAGIIVTTGLVMFVFHIWLWISYFLLLWGFFLFLVAIVFMTKYEQKNGRIIESKGSVQFPTNVESNRIADRLLGEPATDKLHPIELKILTDRYRCGSQTYAHDIGLLIAHINYLQERLDEHA